MPFGRLVKIISAALTTDSTMYIVLPFTFFQICQTLVVILRRLWLKSLNYVDRTVLILSLIMLVIIFFMYHDLHITSYMVKWSFHDSTK